MDTLVGLLLLWGGWFGVTFGLLTWHSQQYMNQNRSSIPYSKTYLNAQWQYATDRSAGLAGAGAIFCAAATTLHFITLL